MDISSTGVDPSRSSESVTQQVCLTVYTLFFCSTFSSSVVSVYLSHASLTHSHIRRHSIVCFDFFFLRYRFSFFRYLPRDLRLVPLRLCSFRLLCIMLLLSVHLDPMMVKVFDSRVTVLHDRTLMKTTVDNRQTHPSTAEVPGDETKEVESRLIHTERAHGGDRGMRHLCRRRWQQQSIQSKHVQGNCLFERQMKCDAMKANLWLCINLDI